MELTVIRYSDNGESTLGLLLINGKFSCYTLEDEYRDQKVMGETCIPEGTYKVELRTEGTHHRRFLEKFGEVWHKGMLHVKDVPDFKWILIHIGNDDDDTDGCLLVADTSTENITRDGKIYSSTTAYKRIYPIIRDALLSGEVVSITYVRLEALLA